MGALTYNLGNGQVFSVQQVINVVQKIMLEDATQAKQVLNWQPEYAYLETIIRHAWAWRKQSTASRTDS
jgi:UDP-glucose 4-epimerase